MRSSRYVCYLYILIRAVFTGLNLAIDKNMKLFLLKHIFFIAIIFPLVACDQSHKNTKNLDDSEFKTNYESNLKLWIESSEGKSYSFTYSRTCFCFEEFSKTKVTVDESGEIVEVNKINSSGALESVSANNFDQYISIEELFDIVKKKIDKKASQVKVEYDKISGFPTLLYVDYDFRMADDEISYEIKDLNFSID
jgi:hypothetical protein